MKKKNLHPIFTFVISFCIIIQFANAQQVTRPSAVFQIQKAAQNMLKKIATGPRDHYENELMEELRNNKRGIKKNSVNNFSNSIVTPEQKKSGICPPLVQTNFEGNRQTPYYLLPVGFGPSECDIAI